MLTPGATHTDELRLEEPTPGDIEFLEDRLYEFNRAKTGIGDGQLLGVFLLTTASLLSAAPHCERDAGAARES
jgi:hypothetical protein